MLNEYESKRLEYNLALNNLNKFKKDFENKRIELTKRKFDSEVKKQEKNIEELKKIMDDFFEQNKDEISFNMLKNQLEITEDYNFYNEELVLEDGKNYIYKKTKDDILFDMNCLKEKVQKRYDNKFITLIIYNDLNRCIDIYSENLLNKWKTKDKKKFVSIEEQKVIKKKNSIKKKEKNTVFFRVILPLSFLDLICLLFILIRHGECFVGSSETLSAVLCAFMVMSKMITIVLTPILVIYYIVKGVSLLTKKKKLG